MIRSLYTAATGMQAQQLYMDTISNNLANVNTTGFKKQKAEFEDLMYQTLREPGVRNYEGEVAPSGIQVGLGVKTAATQRIFAQGSLKETNNDMDVAIKGRGFFQIYMPDGSTAYTRDGTFKLSSDGTIVTSSGFPVAPDITVPEDAQNLQIDGRGRVYVSLPGEEESVQIGQMELARFINPAGLKAAGGNLYTVTEASGRPIVNLPGDEGMGLLQQGYVEASNVELVDEMVNMISAQRSYEIVSKSIQVSEDMMDVINRLKR